MDLQKEKIALLTGGYTPERGISFKSALNVAEKLDRKRFEVYLIYIVPEGWYYESEGGVRHAINRHDFSLALPQGIVHFDVAFICIHGVPGENGCIQGYLELTGIPYTSCRQQAAALTMNKFFTKAAVSHLPGLHIARSVIINAGSSALEELRGAGLRYPVFIKPNTGGSSIGTAKAANEEEAWAALDTAFDVDYSGQIIVEEYIEGTEYSVGAFLRDGAVEVLPPSEVISEREFFDFDAKYGSSSPVDITPGRIAGPALDELRTLVSAVFRALDCHGVVRIDFIQERVSGRFFFLEINTIPGQTDSSFIPKQLRAAGFDVSAFFSQLIDEAYRLVPKITV
ncbi:D-alanine-D-alanine ligase [Parapedobacter luteus]|uniref:D-alanine--D-alanine ligase n=1 Tax=Parapedobacter luteus TaxID=623280 RepID=A0A1T5CV75_9SPHI|nr:D-alanine--D-alanine ligase [Parapedobacter luteus]SKB63324.1 D-alanine-D-alanine ligase [Parapedobacter luteus]